MVGVSVSGTFTVAVWVPINGVVVWVALMMGVCVRVADGVSAPAVALGITLAVVV